MSPKQCECGEHNPHKAFRKNLWSKFIFTAVISLGVVLLFQEYFMEKNNLLAYCVLLGAAVWNRMDSRNKAYKASAHFGPVEVDIASGDTGEEPYGDDDCPPSDDDAAMESDDGDHRHRRDRDAG